MKDGKDIRILFLDILTDDPKIKQGIDDGVYAGKNYSESMRRAFSLPAKNWTLCDASQGVFPQNIKIFDAVVIGGSTMDPMKGLEKPWMKATYKFIKRLIKANTPILGICGGLQFVARAFGKKVIFNPKGREFGGLPIALTTNGRSDPLFKDIPDNPIVSLSHKCMVADMGEDWKLLASSKLCEYQAYAIGSKIRLTQFHPEMTAKELKLLAKFRKASLMKEGFFKDDEEYKDFLAAIADNNAIGKKIIDNFINYFI